MERGVRIKTFKWSQFFKPGMETPMAPVWVSLPLLPLQMFHPSSLADIANCFGEYLSMDMATKMKSRLSVARILVDVDLSRPLFDKIWISCEDKGFWQQVIFEHKPLFCFKCYNHDHTEDRCITFTQSKKPAVKVPPLAPSVKSSFVFVEKPAVSGSQSANEDPNLLVAKSVLSSSSNQVLGSAETDLSGLKDGSLDLNGVSSHSAAPVTPAAAADLNVSEEPLHTPEVYNTPSVDEEGFTLVKKKSKKNKKKRHPTVPSPDLPSNFNYINPSVTSKQKSESASSFKVLSHADEGASYSMSLPELPSSSVLSGVQDLPPPVSSDNFTSIKEVLNYVVAVEKSSSLSASAQPFIASSSRGSFSKQDTPIPSSSYGSGLDIPPCSMLEGPWIFLQLRKKALTY